MRLAACDTETMPFAPGEMAPLLVCVTACVPQGEPRIYDHKQGAALIEELVDEALASPDDDPLLIVMHNGPYDWAVLAREVGTLSFLKKVFALHDAGRVYDTLVAEWLLDNAEGVLNLQEWNKSSTGYRRPPNGAKWYSLGRLSQKYLGIELDKTSGVRTDFGYLRGTPLEQWPGTHIDYAKADAKATVEIAAAQIKRNADDEDKRNPLVDLAAQCKAYWALHLISIWGLTSDLPAVAEYKAELQVNMERMRETLATITIDGEALLAQKHGKKRPVKDEGKWQTSTKTLRALIERAFKAQGSDAPLTEPSKKFPDGQVATDADTIEACEDESLRPWKEYKHAEKMLSTYVPQLEAGIVHPRYGITANGRVSHYDPNIGNLPRKGKVRECYSAREGFYLCSVDYGAQELVTFGQIMHWTIGPNSLADALNQDLDPHLMLACTRLGIDYAEGLRRKKAGDELVKAHRQKAKGANFGYPGGMGPETFINHARNQDPPEIYTLEEATEAREAWFKTWNQDPRKYFRWVTTAIENGWVKQFVSKRVRGGGSHGPGVGFTDGANTFFSGLAADMSKAATYEVVRRCYTETASALFGSRVIAFLHDEILAEIPIVRAHDAAHEIAAVMLEVGKRYCPDVKSKAEPALMVKWLKGADYKTNDAGILIPWEPERKAA